MVRCFSLQEQRRWRTCSSSTYPRPRVLRTSPLFHFFLNPQKSRTAFLLLPSSHCFFIIRKERQSPNTAEYKEQKKREKQRLEREKKEQKERERKDNEMKKKFKVCSSKSPLLNALFPLDINYWSFYEKYLQFLHSALLEAIVLHDASFSSPSSLHPLKEFPRSERKSPTLVSFSHDTLFIT